MLILGSRCVYLIPLLGDKAVARGTEYKHQRHQKLALLPPLTHMMNGFPLIVNHTILHAKLEECGSPLSAVSWSRPSASQILLYKHYWCSLTSRCSY